MKLPPITMRFEHDWQLAEVRAIQIASARAVLEEAKKACAELRNSTMWKDEKGRYNDCVVAIDAIKIEDSNPNQTKG